MARNHVCPNAQTSRLMKLTFGQLIDRLTIVNNKLWHQEEIRHPESGFSAKERLAASDAITLLNKERNELVQAVDEYLAECLENPKSHRISRQFKDYRKH